MKKVMVGIDLHGNNVMVGIVDADGYRVQHRKLECDLRQIDQFLSPYKAHLERVAVESTFNWYWLVDGLHAAGYPVVLANPAKMDQYSGIKHADDKNDAYFLAELLRLNILPTGHIYDPKLRPVRDLLRRRMNLVRQRTALLLSFKSLYQRTTGQSMELGRLKAMEVEAAAKLYTHPANQLIAQVQKQHIEALDQSIHLIEKAVLAVADKLPNYQRLQTLPGVGVILGLTIAMEVGPIERFASPGEFASYCRAVDSQRLSNGKKKGDNNQKCGNKYLAWAFVEAAHGARRFDPHCRRWYDRKAAKTRTVIATKALACKLAKAAWHVMAQQTDYQASRMFPELAGKNLGEQASASNGVGENSEI
jgi:transposase